MRWARAQGLRVGLLRPITLWPFPTEAVQRMAEQVSCVIVPEMNLKQMCGRCRPRSAAAPG